MLKNLKVGKIKYMKKIWVFFGIGVCFIIVGIWFWNSNPASYLKKDLKTEVSIAKVPQDKSLTPAVKGVETIREKIKVNHVIDGDTVVLEDGRKIRYLGINSPEVGQPFHNEALKLNEDLVLEKEVYLEYDKEKSDRYGRTLAYLFINNLLVNAEIAIRGLAISESIQPNIKYQKEIMDAQAQAKANCQGMWESLCKENADSSNEKACVKITNINADAKGNDNQNKNGEWIEFMNSCGQTISLNGYLLKDTSASNKYVFKDFSLNANSLVKLYSGCGQNNSSDLYWQCPQLKYAVWNNSGDEAFLYNEKGELVADYKY